MTDRPRIDIRALPRAKRASMLSEKSQQASRLEDQVVSLPTVGGRAYRYQGARLVVDGKPQDKRRPR